MSLHVVQGERELVSDCRSLARFELRGIPPMVAGSARIRITFQVDADGMLNVTARELVHGVEAAIAVKPSYGLSDDEIMRMLQDSNQHAQEDMQARALREQQVEAEQLLESVQNALQQDGAALLNDAAQARIRACMDELRAVLTASDHAALKRAIVKLNDATVPFAQARMDKSVAHALSGRKLTEIASD